MALAIGADEKKKLYVLGGLLAAIGVVGVVLYLPKRKAPETSASVAVTATPTSPASNSATPPATATASTGGASGNLTAASLVSVNQFRDDPFKLFPKPALPPVPRPKIVVPPGPVFISSPGEVDISLSEGGMMDGTGLPPMQVEGASRPLADMPPIRVRRETVIPVVPRLTSGGAGSGVISDSPNKRISGVIIGDSVRALLEITDGDIVTTRVVQPGDEVDGIRILRIERVVEGGRTITRLIIRENGEDRSVVLKPSTKPAGSTTGRTTTGG